MADYKDLHKRWKKAKETAKGTWDHWSGMYMKVSASDVQYGTPSWPKFNLDLGPSLDKLEKGKDIEKSKAKALKAVKQYKTDISSFCKLAKDVPTGEDKMKAAAKELISRQMKALEEVREEIEEALNK